jgi:hypothetical protein
MKCAMDKKVGRYFERDVGDVRRSRQAWWAAQAQKGSADWTNACPP